MNWTRGQLIGHGSSAVVSLGRALPRGDIFAVKSVEVSRSDDLRKEQEIHLSLDCERIIGYKGCDITLENDQSLYNIFLEYAPKGTIVDAIRRKGSGLGESQVKQYTRELLQGLEYLHSKGIVHCDIKGANVLVTSEGVKIGDFGCSKRVDDVAGCHSSKVEIAGTPMYMAPEVARGEQQGYPADVWALGCTVLEMATGLAPWPNIANNPVSALYRIGFSSEVPEIPGFLSGQAQDFLSKCFKRDPKERWTVAELLHHPFVVYSDGLTQLTVKKAHGPCSETPTCILDHGLWESMNEVDLAQENVAEEGSEKSPGERMKELSSSVQEFCNWALDEDWITVRSSPTYEAEKVSSGLGHAELLSVQPNMTTASFEFSPIIFDFPFLSTTIELLNFQDHMYGIGMYVGNGKTNSYEILESEYTCKYMNHLNENFSLSKFPDNIHVYLGLPSILLIIFASHCKCTNLHLQKHKGIWTIQRSKTDL